MMLDSLQVDGKISASIHYLSTGNARLSIPMKGREAQEQTEDAFLNHVPMLKQTVKSLKDQLDTI